MFYGHLPLNFVDPRETRSPREHPYSFDGHFIAGNHSTVTRATESVYSDRFKLWDAEKAARCDAEHKYPWTNLAMASRWLTDFYGREIKCVALAMYCNASNGYPYHRIWFREG